MGIAITTLSAIAGALTVFLTLYMKIRKITKENEKNKKEMLAGVLQDAKEMDDTLKAKLESRIEAMKAELKNLELNINKDIAFVKESYKSDIKVLGDKIEDLRKQLNEQHSQLLTVLTNLINKG